MAVPLPPGTAPFIYRMRIALALLVPLAVAAPATAHAQASAPTTAAAPDGAIEGLKAKFVDVNGVRTRYYEYGQGDTILLIHGGGMGGASTANNWSKNIRGLAERFHVLAVDRLAQGLTGNPKDDADFTNEGTVEHLYQFVQTLKLGAIHVVGHSSGGAIAFYFAAEHPEIAKTLTVVAHGPGMPRPPNRRTKFADILEKCPPDTASYEHRKCRLLALAHSADTFSQEYADADEYMGRQPKAVEARTRMAAATAARPGWPEQQNAAYRQRMWDRAKAGLLPMPILIYVAKQDTLSWDAKDRHGMQTDELDFFDIVGTKNPRVKMILINEAGHFPYREHPDQFNADLIQFIDFWSGRTTGSRGGTGHEDR